MGHVLQNNIAGAFRKHQSLSYILQTRGVNTSFMLNSSHENKAYQNNSSDAFLFSCAFRAPSEAVQVSPD